MTAQAELQFGTQVRPWRPVKARKVTCTRDPAAGPGTCWLWWEGCPQAEARNCYIAWWGALPKETQLAIWLLRNLAWWARGL